MHTADLGIATIRDGDTLTVAITGEVDIANGHELRDAGLQALHERPQELVIDLTAVTFMDSAGLGHLLRVLRAARPTPARVLVSHPNVVRLLTMTGLTRAFAVQQVA